MLTNSDVDKIRGVIKEEIISALEPVNKKLDEHSEKLDEHTEKLDAQINKLDILWDQVIELTGNSVEIKDAIKRIETSAEQNSSDVLKLKHRTGTIEQHLESFVPHG